MPRARREARGPTPPFGSLDDAHPTDNPLANSRHLGSHVPQSQFENFKKELKMAKKKPKCVICGNEVTRRRNKTCSKQCEGERRWTANAYDKIREMMRDRVWPQSVPANPDPEWKLFVNGESIFVALPTNYFLPEGEVTIPYAEITSDFEIAGVFEIEEVLLKGGHKPSSSFHVQRYW